jgi:hypothetical protein
MRMVRDIGTQYFGFQPAAQHRKGCSRISSDTWVVTRHTWTSFDGETTETTFRLACFECGAVTFIGLDGEYRTEATSVADIGFGAKPERVAGLWLHPGPHLIRGDDYGPEAFYVTRGKDRPRDPADVLGIVARHFGPRRGIKWAAGLGVTEYGRAKTGVRLDFGSKRAAVAWIAAQPNDDAEAPAAT